jgi:phosphoribosylanthranilate isomerase
MTRVKICGLKRDEDIHYVNHHRPEYIGFVFAESKRRIEAERAKELSSLLEKGIKKVGVFVNETLETILRTTQVCQLDIVQLHGDESVEAFKELKRNLGSVEVWKVVRVKDKAAVKNLEQFYADAYVLDTFIEGCYGGVGKTFDWSLAVEAKNSGKIILAGGLTANNVNEAIKAVQPFAVDISSGVELEGLKDEDKIKKLIYTVRRSEY